MRCTQVFGLTNQARKILDKKGRRVECIEEGVKIFPNGLRTPFKRTVRAPNPAVQVTVYDHFYGMFPEEEKYDLRRFEFPDGSVVEEFVQANPWSSGPCIFLALRDGKTGKAIQLSQWPEADIENA